MPVDHSDTIIDIKNLSFGYGSKIILDHVNLQIHRGDYLGVVGPNGGGKTTLIKLILGLLKPDSGKISLFGQPQAQFSAWSQIGYIAQKATSFDRFFPVTVRDVVAMGRLPHKGLLTQLSTEDQDFVTQAMSEVKIEKLQNTLVGELSGGQQQRVFIARALAQRANVLFLDEPTTGIDAPTQGEFYALLKKLNQELGLTLVVVSHEQDVIRNEVTEVAFVNQHLDYYRSAAQFLKEGHSHG